jgi:hypothetical protein
LIESCERPNLISTTKFTEISYEIGFRTNLLRFSALDLVRVTEMKEEAVDEELVRWNDIFKNLIVDAKELTEDLLQGVNYVLGSGILLLAMGFLTIYFVVIRNVQMGTDFVLIALVVSSPAVILGLWNIKKYFDLRRKYSRLYLYQREIERR